MMYFSDSLRSVHLLTSWWLAQEPSHYQHSNKAAVGIESVLLVFLSTVKKKWLTQCKQISIQERTSAWLHEAYHLWSGLSASILCLVGDGNRVYCDVTPILSGWIPLSHLVYPFGYRPDQGVLAAGLVRVGPGIPSLPPGTRGKETMDYRPGSIPPINKHL